MQYQVKKTKSKRKGEDMKTELEEKEVDEEEDEESFITVVRFTEDNPDGKATALLNWRLLVTKNEYIDLQEMMNVVGLSEMDSIGDYFTWSNKQNVGTIYSRIDRVLGNVKWFQDHLDYHLKILPPSISDHALLCVEGKMQPKNKTRRFKFYNCMVNMIGYEEVVHNSWNRPIRGTPMHVLWQKLQRLSLILF